MKFRPCIDIHDGAVKQIVGSNLLDGAESGPVTNFTAEQPPGWFAGLYRRDGLTGGHVIQLGSGNEAAAAEALAAWPGGLQIGGGITLDNAPSWIDRGAAAVIVTSFVFYGGTIHMERLSSLTRAIGRERLVLDLSCRKRGDGYYIVTDRWQNFTREAVTFDLLDRLSAHCFEYLIHAVDVEGKCSGIETPLVEMLGRWQGIPVTYAGGIRSMEDIHAIGDLGRDAIDFTVGSALDIFGGSHLAYRDLVRDFGPGVRT